MQMPGRRHLNVVGFAICASLFGYALYAQYGLNLEPCPLCVFQRIAVVAIGLVFLVAALHHPAAWGRFGYALLAAVTGIGGMAVAARHVWLQHLPPDQVPSCGPGFGYLMQNFPLHDALTKIFSGSGECAEVDWQFLGLSMPTWVLIWVALLSVVGTWNNLRR